MVFTGMMLLNGRCKIQRVLLVTLGVHASLIDIGATLRHNLHNFSLSDCKNTTSLDQKQRLFCSTLTKSVEMESLEKAKELAANLAVDEYIQDNTAVGIGSGSTIVYAVQRIAHRVKSEGLQLVCIPTSFQARQLIIEHKLKLGSLETYPELDVTIDGADEVDKDLILIKGGGGCLAQEKIVASCAKKLIIIADYTLEDQLLSLIAYLLILTFDYFCENPTVGPVVTDNNNFILDWVFPENLHHDWKTVSVEIKMIPGVVETGLFVNMASQIFFGMSDGSVKRVSS